MWRYFQIVPDQLTGGARRQPSLQGGGREGRGEGRLPALVQRLQVPHAERGTVTTGKCTIFECRSYNIS